MIDSIVVRDNEGKKRLRAVIKYSNGDVKTVSFGQKEGSGGTFSDGATEQKKEAYIARHRVREDWADERTAGFASRWVLWQARSNKDIEKILQQKTKAKTVSVKFKRIPVKK